MSDPYISVVIPSYNRAHTLKRAIDSVWVQDIQDLEILVVDDCSTDDTQDRLREWAVADSRLRWIRHERNRGEAGARNTGVRGSRGKYIAFLDSDDEWLPGKLKQQLAALEESAPSVVGCFCGQYIVELDGSEQVVRDWSDSLPITDRNILVEGCGLGMGNTFVVQRDVYESVGYYDEELPLFVDSDWLSRLLRRYDVMKISTPLIKYHKSPFRRGEVIERASEMFARKNRDHFRDFGVLDRGRIRSRLYTYTAQSYRVHGPRRRFIAFLGLSLLCNPLQSWRHYALWLAACLHLVQVGPKQPAP